MPKPASDKSSAGTCSHLECISDRRRTVLRIFLAAFAVLLVFSLAAAPASAVPIGNWTDYVDDYTFTSDNITVSGDTFTIKTAYGLAWVSKDINTKTDNQTGKTFIIADDVQDIDLGAHEWTPIGKSDTYIFKGTFDGQGQTISNLYINDDESDYQGLFGYTQNSNIKDLNLIGVTVIGRHNVSGLVGANYGGTVTNCHAEGTVTGDWSVGGLVGLNYAGTIDYCNANVAVTGYRNVGGLVGLNYAYSGTASIDNSHAEGTVTSTGDYVGGLVGVNVAENSETASIDNSYATGNVAVTGTDIEHVGGLVGFNGGTITDCYAEGTVTGNSGIGGLIGINCGTIENSYATGEVAGTGECVGGLVGDNSGDIENCYATGAVDGGTNVGGLVGCLQSDCTITNCYATGAVTGYSAVGGLVGDNNGDIENCYATGSVKGNENVGGLVGYNSGEIINIIALNPSVSATRGSNVGRVVGLNEGSDTITNCYAWEGIIGGTWSNIGENKKDGADASSLDVWANLIFYMNTLRWGITIDGDTDWNINNGGVTAIGWTIPYLSSFGAAPSDTQSIKHLKPLIVKYNGNGVVGTTEMPDQMFTYGVSQDLRTNSYMRTGYTFAGWNSNADGSGTDYDRTGRFTSDTTLYAKWNSASTPTHNPSSSGSSTDSNSGNYDKYPRSATNGGLISFGTSPIVKSVDLPGGVSGPVVLTAKSTAAKPEGEDVITVFELDVPGHSDGKPAIISFQLPAEEIRQAGYTKDDIGVLHYDSSTNIWSEIPVWSTGWILLNIDKGIVAGSGNWGDAGSGNWEGVAMEGEELTMGHREELSLGDGEELSLGDGDIEAVIGDGGDVGYGVELHLQFNALTIDFSPFAIIYKVGASKEVTQPEVTTVVPTAEPEQTYVEPTMPATVPTPEQTKSPVGLVGLGLGLLGAFAVIRRK